MESIEALHLRLRHIETVQLATRAERQTGEASERILAFAGAPEPQAEGTTGFIDLHATNILIRDEDGAV
jgi:hypothetical protein